MQVDLRASSVRVRTARLSDLDVLVRCDADGGLSTVSKRDDGRRDQLRRRIESSPDLRADGLCFLTVESDGDPVGDVQARAPRYAFPPGVCEIGITLVAEARGLGIGRVAVRLFTDFLLGDGWSRVQGSTELGNVGMRRAFEHAGFTLESVAAAYLPVADGGRADAAVYVRIVGS